jgi:hypothetical protein
MQLGEDAGVMAGSVLHEELKAVGMDTSFTECSR